MLIFKCYFLFSYILSLIKHSRPSFNVTKLEVTKMSDRISMQLWIKTQEYRQPEKTTCRGTRVEKENLQNCIKTKQCANKHWNTSVYTELECKHQIKQIDQTNFSVSCFKHFEERYAWTKDFWERKARQKNN